MIKQQKLEDLIREKVPLGKLSAQGYYSLKCQCCHDYKERGGFRFIDNQIIYNCFNCGKVSKYEEMSGEISRNMRGILNAFGIEDSEIDTVVSSAFFHKKETSKITMSALKKVNTATPPVKFPPKTFRLGETFEDIDFQQRIVNYLVERCVDLDKYRFFFSLDPRMKDRVIIPFYRNGMMIYWQARSLNDSEKKRYDNPSVSRDAVMFNMDQLQRYTPAPLFVSEGAFDAMMFDGVATLGSKLSDAKLELLAKSQRRLVFVIDKDKNGAQYAEAVLSAGYEITFAPDGASDINRSVQRFGRAWTAHQLIQNIPTNSASAKLAISLKCR